jgi:hypothetical protein
VYQSDNKLQSPTMTTNGNDEKIFQKRTHKDVERARLLNLAGIMDPSSGKILTVAEAIKLHILDVRTGEMVLISGERISLEKAAEHNLIDSDLANKLNDHLDAVRHELSEAENGNSHDVSEKRIKVTTTTSVTILPSNIKTIADAIKDGSVDPIKGIYKLPDGNVIPITEAYQRGLLIKNECVKIKSTPMCLADAIAHDLVDQAGWIVDRNAGDKFRLDSAVKNDLIITDCQEIVDARNDVKITLAKAIENGIINVTTGRYVNSLTKEKLTFVEAKNRQLIARPMTLKDVCDLNQLDRNGMVYSPTRKRQLNVVDAIKVGILDGDKIKSISTGDESCELLTLNEAIVKNIVRSDNKFCKYVTNDLMTIQSAVDEGLISSVTQKSIFNVDAFKDSYSIEFVSLNEAISKGILVRTAHNIFKINMGKNQLISIEDGIEMGIVRAEVYEMLNRRVGVFLNDKELSVLDLVLYDMLDPKSGYLLDVDQNYAIIPLNHAIERNIITPDGALLLSSLLNITLTTETLKKMQTRYITYANTKVNDYSSAETTQSTPDVDNGSIKLSDAIEQNIFNAESGVMTIPNTDRLVNFDECIQLGLINSESLRVIDPKFRQEINVQQALDRNIIDATGNYHSASGGVVSMSESIENGTIILDDEKSEKNERKQSEKPNINIKLSDKGNDDDDNVATSPEPLEISPGKFYDPSTALVIDMKTGKSENIIQAVKDNLVDSTNVHIVDYATGDVISYEDAIKKDMIVPQTGEIVDSSGNKISLIDAVKMGLLVVAGAPVVAAVGAINSLKLIFDPSTNQHIPVELAYERGLVSRDEISDYSALFSQTSSFDIPTPKDMAQTPLKSQRKHSVNDTDMPDFISSSENDEKPIPLPRKSLTIHDKPLLSDGVKQQNEEEEPDSSSSLTPFDQSSLMSDLNNRIENIGEDFGSNAVAAAPATNVQNDNAKSQIMHVSVNEALQRGLLDIKNEEYTDPNTNQIVSMHDAVQQGLLISSNESENASPSKHASEASENNDVEPITSKSIKLQPNEEIKSSHDNNKANVLQTKNDILPTNEMQRKIQAFKSENSALSEKASVPTLSQNDDASGAAAAENSQLGQNIANAAKLGLMAIVGAPILAGMAVADSVKGLVKKSDENSHNQSSIAASSTNKMAFSTIQELNESLSAENNFNKYPVLEINEKLTHDMLENVGAYDKRTNSFVDPSTSEKVAFDDFIFNCGIFDPEMIYVKELNQNNDKYVPLAVAIEKHLIDRNTGMMVEPKTGKRIPFFDCLERKWIIQKEPEKLNSISLQDALDSGLLDEKSGKVAVDGILLPVSEALHSGVLEIDNISVRDSSGNIVPLVKAIEDGMVDLKNGIVVDSITGENKSLDALFKEGNLLKGIKCPISLEAAISCGLYDKENNKIKNNNKLLSIQKAIDNGVIDANNSLIKDINRDEVITLQKALDDKLIENDLVKCGNDKSLPLDVALAEKLITTKPMKMTLIDVIVKEYYKVDEQKILNPMNGMLETIECAIKSGYLDIDTTLIVDDRKENVLSAHDAIRNGLIDITKGRLTYPDLNLKNAYERGYILSAEKPVSLSDAILRKIYNPTTRKLEFNGLEKSLSECIEDDEISSNDLIIHDPKSNNIISVSDAIKTGLIDAKNGYVNDSQRDGKITFNEAVDRGIIILSKRKCSLPEAVFKGLYDPTSGTFANTLTTEKLSTDRAIKRGFIDPQSTVVNVGGKILPFELSVECGMVDAKRGTITDEYGNKIDFREAFDRGILVEVRKPIGLYEALVKNIYDEASGLFMDPKTGKHLTLEMAISEKLIDPNSVQVKDSTKNIYRDVSLLDAIYSGMIDDKSHVKIDSRMLTLRQAFDLGILCDSKAPISIQRAIHQGIYDSQSGKFIDPNTNKKMTLHEAMRQWIINPQLPCYFDENDEILLSLNECCRIKMIDRREGVFKEPGSNVFISLNEALNLGLIVDIESGGFGLYEMLAMKLYDVNERKFVNPSNGCLVTMTDAIQDDLISPLSSLVKDILHDCYIKLNDAIKSSIIDTQNGSYVYPDKRQIDLQEARKLGLIVTQQKLLTLENVIALKLYDTLSGKFVDPSTNNKKIDLLTCIDNGLIDAETTVLKNNLTGQEVSLRDAIKRGDIDVESGCVIDPDSKISTNFKDAFENGILVTIKKPLTGNLPDEKAVKIENQLGATSKISGNNNGNDNEISIEDAIKSGLIEPDKVYVKDPNTGQFVSLSQALADNPNFIDTWKKTTSIEPSAMLFSLDPNCVIYKRVPESFEAAVESGHLNLSNGMYANPDNDTNCNLKEAITCGLIDPDSAFIKDGVKGKLIRLPEAFRKGLIDSDKFNVVDTNNSKLLSLKTAVDNAILFTPKRSLDLLEALKFNLYEGDNNDDNSISSFKFKDPFISAAIAAAAANSTSSSTTAPSSLVTLSDAITKGLIDPSTTLVRDVDNSKIAPLSAAISSGLIDPINGHLVTENENIDFVKAHERGLLLPAEQRVSNSVGTYLLCHILFNSFNLI